MSALGLLPGGRWGCLHGGLLLTAALPAAHSPALREPRPEPAGSALNPSPSLRAAPPPSLDFLAERNKLLYDGELFQGN